MIEFLFKTLSLPRPLTRTEMQRLEGAVQRIEHCEPDTEIVPEGVDQNVCRVVIGGWAARTKSLASGKRQITALHLPGDFIDLHGFLLKRLDHSIVALTRCRIAVMPHEAIRAITDDMPDLARLLWTSTLLDGAQHRQWLAVLGQLSAAAQIAHLLCELDVRLGRLGLAQAHCFDLPLTQEEIADCLGMTSVHVNRMVQQLRSEGLIDWRRGRMQILDPRRLARLAAFDGAYLLAAVVAQPVLLQA